MHMADVLVTGGAGFIGSATCDLLIENGYDVAVADDLSTGKAENLNPKAAFYETDICDSGLCEAFKRERPRYIMHTAAQIDVRKSIADPSHDSAVNVGGTINVLECARRYGAEKIVYSSSGGAVYGEPQSNPVSEDHPINPLCPYGASKFCGEKYIETYGRLYNMKYAILRYSNVYGPRQDPLGEAGVVAIFTKKIADKKTPIIFGDGEQTRDFCHVSDIARANVCALEGEFKCGAYNVGSGAPTSVNQITKMLFSEFASDMRPEHAKEVPGEVRHIHLDISLIEKELGWKPETGLEDGLKLTKKWIMSRQPQSRNKNLF